MVIFFLGHTLLAGSFELSIFFAEVVYFTGLVLIDKFLSLYYSQHEARLCNKIISIVAGLLFSVIITIWIIKPVLINNYPIWIFSLYTFIPAFILFFYFVVRFNPSFKRISQEEMRSFSSFSSIVLAANIIQYIAYRADYWLISIYYDHTTVGIYSQASKFAQLLWIIPGILAGLIIPALKNEYQKLSEGALLSLCRVSFYIHIILSLIVIASSLAIYLFFLPGIYFDGFVSLLIMIPGYLLFTTAIILAAYFSANRLLRVNLIVSALCCIIIVLLDLLLIPAFSYKGAAIANLVAYSITTAYIIYRLKQYLNVSFKDFFAIRRSDFNLFSGEVLITDNKKA